MLNTPPLAPGPCPSSPSRTSRLAFISSGVPMNLQEGDGKGESYH